MKILIWLSVATLFSGIAMAQKNIITNSLGVKFVRIPAGSFSMGSAHDVKQAGFDEMPQHSVTISRSFYMSEHEVTQREWQTVMGDNPSAFSQGDLYPVQHIRWSEALDFIEKLNKREGLSCPRKLNYRPGCYRFPTEAEWEYTARAGTTTLWSCGDDESCLQDHAWYKANSDIQPHPIKRKRPNPWGLYDMHGNVWEMVWDWKGPYPTEAVIDPIGAKSSTHGVLRGGSFSREAAFLRTTKRYYGGEGMRYGSVGFRLVKNPGLDS